MDRFIVSLPKSSTSSHKLISKKHKIAVNPSGNCKKRNCVDVSASSEKENAASELSGTAKSVQSLFGPPSTTKKVQMYLDLGQKSLHETILCQACSLLYTKNDPEDIKRHEKYCKAKSLPPHLSSQLLRKCNMVKEFSEEKASVLCFKNRSSLISRGDKDSDCLEFKTFSDPSISKLPAIIKLMEMMKEELGAVDQYVSLLPFFSVFCLLSFSDLVKF
jgi:hypothetical protein